MTCANLLPRAVGTSLPGFLLTTWGCFGRRELVKPVRSVHTVALPALQIINFLFKQ